VDIVARIFVSSTFKDLEECREKVRLSLKRIGHEDIAMEYFVAEDRRPLDKCLEDVTTCDLYVGVFAWRYGYVPNGYDKSITELEYLKAVEARKECLVFLLHEDAYWPSKFVDIGKGGEKIRALRNELSSKYIVSTFKSADELASLVVAAVHKWEIRSRNLVSREVKISELDLKQYKEAVYKRYFNIDLDALTPSQKEDYLKIKLIKVFVEQNVRENPPPIELPKEIWKKMHEEWDPEKECIPDSLTIEELKRAKKSYYSKNPKPVLDIISDERNRYLVILGDPGSGKSMLTNYIILSVLQINNDKKLSKIFNSYLPLRVELREFAGFCSENKCNTFFDYFQYLKENEGYSFTREKVENYLKNDGKAIIIFDGLDEIFDPREWERINRMIVGFTLDYPQVRIIVTSRVIGYKRKILDDAGFFHFTLQDFEKGQIETFLDKWYPFFVDENEIESRKSRILRALKDSPSLRQLAGNPLLLTILAVMGKNQELPRERWKLYGEAASVMVENWEVNKHLNRSSVEMDFIGEDDKKELLMKIAFKMQSGPEGLAGNFIHRKTLQQEIESYLQNRYQKSPSEVKLITKLIIEQLWERNFILCLYGANFYGFVHRTFLEYFCALDIVQKFDNRELNIETLKSNYFEQYWEDPTWHEVLSLVCGMKEEFAGDIIESLMQVYDPHYFGDRPPWNIVLAIKCLSEIQSPSSISEITKKLLERIVKLFRMVWWTQDIDQFLAEKIVPASKLVSNRWPYQNNIINQFSRSPLYVRYDSDMRFYFVEDSLKIDLNLNRAWAELIAGVNSTSKIIYKEALRKITDKEYSSLLSILILGKFEPKNEKLFSLFSDLSIKSRYYFVRQSAIKELAHNWYEDPKTLKVIEQAAMNDKKYDVRITAVEELAHYWHNNPETLDIIKQISMTDDRWNVRQFAIQEIAHRWHDDPETLKFLKQKIIMDADAASVQLYVMISAIQELARYWHNDPETLKFLKQFIEARIHRNVSSAAIEELARYWHNDPETLKFIKYCLTKNEDEGVRGSAVRELARYWHNNPETLNIIKQWAITDEEGYVRCSAVWALAHYWHEDPQTLNIIIDRAMNDEEDYVKSTAVKELARYWHNDSKVLKFITQDAMIYEEWNTSVRVTAIQELARGWHDDPRTIKFIKLRAKNDSRPYIRSAAIQELVRGWHDDPETVNIIKDRAKNDSNWVSRCSAVQALARYWHDDPETLNIIKDRAMKDGENGVRIIAIRELVSGWYENSETLDIIKHMAKTGGFWGAPVRITAIQALSIFWHNDPETMSILKDRETEDKEGDVRNAANHELVRGWSDSPEKPKVIKNEAKKIKSEYVSISEVWLSALYRHDDRDILRIMKERATNSNEQSFRINAIQALSCCWRDDPEVLNIIINRATIDEEVRIRIIAIRELASGWHDNSEILEVIKERAMEDKESSVRSIAIELLALYWHNNPEILNFIKKKATEDKESSVRSTAVQEIACYWCEDEVILNTIKQWILTDKGKGLRSAAIQALVRYWHDDPETFNILKMLANNGDDYMRKMAIRSLSLSWYDDPEALTIIKDRAKNDKDQYVRIVAIQELACHWYDDPETLEFIKLRAMNDKDEYARIISVKEISRCWYDDHETFIFLKQVAMNDEERSVRKNAFVELSRSWRDNPETLDLLKYLAKNDKSRELKNDFAYLLAVLWGEEVN
jgi:HEAT repeat protein/GTPase SAR1 family protein